MRHAELDGPTAVEIIKAVQDKESEPIAHSLLREAWSLSALNRKSSLLIGFTAAEIGIKQHIIRMLPETEYLLKHIQSPSISRLLAYLDTIPSKATASNRKGLSPKAIKAKIDKMMTLRNEIAHRGQLEKGDAALSPDVIEGLLLAVQDLLWLLDNHAGYAWAYNHVSPETRNELET